MNLDIVDSTDFYDFAKTNGLTNDQIDGICDEVSNIVYPRNPEEGFHTVVEVDSLKKALRDLWSEDDSHKVYHAWLGTLDFKSVLF